MYSHEHTCSFAWSIIYIHGSYIYAYLIDTSKLQTENGSEEKQLSKRAENKIRKDITESPSLFHFTHVSPNIIQPFRYFLVKWTVSGHQMQKASDGLYHMLSLRYAILCGIMTFYTENACHNQVLWIMELVMYFFYQSNVFLYIPSYH